MAKDSINKQSYNKIAYKWTEDRNKSFVSNLIIDFANSVKPKGEILDIGCGSGIPNAKYLSERGFRLTGIDAAEKMIEIAKENKIPNAFFELCDFLDYSTTKTFDGILAWDSLFHLPYEQQHGIYIKISGLLNKGGWFLFSHRGEAGEITSDMYDEIFYYSGLSTDTIRNLLTNAGLEIEMMQKDYSERDMDKALVALLKKI